MTVTEEDPLACVTVEALRAREGRKWSRFGPDVIPHLEQILTAPDEQQQAAADLLISALTSPEPDAAERERRARLNRLFSSVSTHESPPHQAIRGW